MVNNRRKNELICRIDLTGFLSISLTLLICFMTMERPHHGIGLELPKSHNSLAEPRSQREDALVVLITFDGHVFLNNQKFNDPYTLREELQNDLHAGAERKVYLKVDIHARYSTVKEVLDQTRLAGIERVCFLTEVARSS
jgi:biopolymer transport protein ExbD